MEKATATNGNDKTEKKKKKNPTNSWCVLKFLKYISS